MNTFLDSAASLQDIQRQGNMMSSTMGTQSVSPKQGNPTDQIGNLTGNLQRKERWVKNRLIKRYLKHMPFIST